MAIGTLTETLDNLYATTWQHMKSDVADNIFDSTPFFAWLKSKGKFKTETGGRFISYPVSYAKNELTSWISKGGTVQLNDFEFLTNTQWDWRYLVASIVRFGVDDQQNRGRQQIINLMNAKMENTQNALEDELEQRLFGGAGGASTGFDGLAHLVQDNPTSVATVGGIDQSAQTWWRNKSHDLTASTFAATGVQEMRTLLNECAQNKKTDRPDIIVSGQSPYEFYEEEALTDHYRIMSTEMAELGFQAQQFKGIPWIWSPQCANDRMYFLNTRYLFFVYDPIMFFDMTDWKPIPDQVQDRAAQIVTACSMITNRRRVHGVMFNIT